MSIISISSFAKALKPGVDEWVGMDYKEFDQEYKAIFDVKTSDQNYEEQVMVNGLGLMKVKPEGEAISYSSMSQGLVKQYRPVVYANGFKITREEIEDNKYTALADFRSRELGKSARITKETVHANVLNRAFSTSYLGADSKALCASDHPLGKGGTYSNVLATAADLSEASLESAVIQLMGFTDDAGKRIAVMPRKLIIAKEDVFNAARILESTLQSDTSNNNVNALRMKGVFPEGYMVNHYLSDSDAWFILTDVGQGLQSFQRRALEITNDTSDFDSENMGFKVTERYSLGWTNPRCIIGSAGA